MEIKKINDHQIRCTLTKTDLEMRNLKLSEIAYGNEKVKSLFRDMMRQASFECGFEAEDIPLMIEIIPFANYADIVITKVEDPEELDTRFSKFAASVHDEDGEFSGISDMLNNLSGDGEDVFNLFRKLRESTSENTSNTKTETAEEEPVASATKNLTRIFYFKSLNDVTRISHVIAPIYHSESTLYKNVAKGSYVLVLTQGNHSVEEFGKICNIMSEYATPGNYANAVGAYLEEHLDPVIISKAISSLAQV